MSKRQSIEIPGVEHKAPIPMGCKIGNIVYSSGISGEDPEKGTTPSDPAEQAAMLMRNVGRFMAAAGGTPDDIIRLTLILSDKSLRKHFDKEWLEMFPDEHSRPARHAVTAEVGGGKLFQVEIVAVLQS